MDPARTADIIELEQVLARYAVGMTRDDVEAVMEVFTPDGTYSAFGTTYTLEDFPALVAAAPKGLFLTGTPVLDLDTRQRNWHRLPDAVLRRADDARHAHRVVHRHVPQDRPRLAAADTLDDLLAAQRRARLGQSARSRAARCRRPRTPRPTRRARRGAGRVQDVGRPLARRARRQSSSPSSRASGRSTSRWHSCARSCGSATTPGSRVGAGPSASAASAAPICCARISARP